MIVDDFIQNKKDTIPEGFYKLLPSICTEPNCNAPMVMTELLTGLQCSNPYCPNKVSQRIFLLLKDIGVDYVTETQVHSFVVDHKIKNVFDVFLYDFEKDGLFGDTLDDVMSKVLTSTLRQNNLFSLTEYIKVAHLPYIDGIAQNIFQNCTDIDSFYTELDVNGLTYLEQLLNVKNNVISVELLKIYEILLLYKDELLQGLNNVSIL